MEIILKKILIILLTVFIIFSCSSGSKKDKESIVAKINDKIITLENLNEYFKFSIGNYLGEKISKEELKQLKFDFLKEMIDEEIILDVAKKEKIEITDFQIEKEMERIKNQFKDSKDMNTYMNDRDIDTDKFKEYLKRKWLVRIVEEQIVYNNIKVTDLEISKYYSKNRENYIRPKSIKVKEIILDTKDEAESIIKRLDEGESFNDIYISLTGKIEEDNTNIYTEQELPKKFSKELFSLRNGSYSKILEDEYGNYHIFKLERKLYKKRIRYSDDVKEAIRKLLLYKKREKRYKQWISSLKKRNYKIMINENYFNN